MFALFVLLLFTFVAYCPRLHRPSLGHTPSTKGNKNKEKPAKRRSMKKVANLLLNIIALVI